MATLKPQEASSSTSRCIYHVFLSFRGEDTRKTFTDHLYTALVHAGFCTFRDDDDIERGENIKSELQKAIQQSRISIVVFSKDYASSRWCLDELVMILERKRTSGLAILPVFYDVDPLQVRKQTKDLAEAFARHEEQLKAETIERQNEWREKLKAWRSALREVADLGGMVLQNQADGCLLTIDECNKLVMHQLLRDMGREIIRQESTKVPGERSRLWHHKDSYDVLREKSGTKTIEGIVLNLRMFKENNSAMTFYTLNSKNQFFDKSLFHNQDKPMKRRRFGYFSWQPTNTASRNSNEANIVEIDAFARMHKLRLLQLDGVQLTGCYEEMPKRLRWLCWRGFPLKSIPSDFPLESLIALDMQYSRLEQVWKGSKLLGLLKSLNLSHSHGLTRIIGFSEIPNLEMLILQGCVSLIEVHESIGKLERLVLLNLKDCKKLGKLPRNIGMLKFLETLIISGCSNLDELPTEIRNMESLTLLQADGIAINRILSTTGEVQPWHASVWPWVSKPRKSPEISWASLPRSLVSLSLADCNLSDNDFTRSFSNLSSLQCLNLSKNPIFSLPDCIKGLNGLQKLNLNCCPRLQSVLGLPSTVQYLSVGHSTFLEKISYQSTSFRLRHVLEHTECKKLAEIEGLFKLEPIGKVDVETINNLRLFNLESMEKVEVNICDGIATSTKKRPIQGLYEFGIFSTFFPGREVPGWFSHKSTGSLISFTVPSLPNLRIRGLNVFSVYTLSNNKEVWDPYPLFTKLSNKTKNLKWIYSPTCFGIPASDEDMVWLSHWKIGNQLEVGDEVVVSIVVGDGFQVKECGINLVYNEQEEEDTQKNTLLSWEEVIDGDLSAYQVNTGAYFLCRHSFLRINDQGSLKEDDWTTTAWSQNLFGDSLDFTDVRGWDWRGSRRSVWEECWQ